MLISPLRLRAGRCNAGRSTGLAEMLLATIDSWLLYHYYYQLGLQP